MPKKLKAVTEIDFHTDCEIAEVLQEAACQRDLLREIIVLGYHKDGKVELIPTACSLERASVMLQFLQAWVTDRINRETKLDGAS